MPDTPALDATAAEARETERAADLTTGNARQTPTEKRKARDKRAAELRIAGYDYASIARALGYANQSGAWKAVNRVRSLALRETGSDLISLELDRLDQLQRAATTKALTGDARAINAALRVMDARSRLLGLNQQRGEERIAEARDAFAVFLGAVQAKFPDPEPMPDDPEEDTA